MVQAFLFFVTMKDSNQIKEEIRYVHMHGQDYRGKVLMVASSPTISEQTGQPVGFWASELTHPMYEFQQAGYEVVVASTAGGALKMDTASDPTHQSGYAAHDIITLGYMQQDLFHNMLKHSQKITETSARDFDALFLVGGQGPMYTFRHNTDLEALFVAFYELNRPCAAVCHATTLLLDARIGNDDLIVKGKSWTGFSNAEENFVDKAAGQQVQPYRIEEEAKKIADTNFKTANPFCAHAIADGNLVTGQQQNSAALAARMVIDLLVHRYHHTHE